MHGPFMNRLHWTCVALGVNIEGDILGNLFAQEAHFRYEVQGRTVAPGNSNEVGGYDSSDDDIPALESVYSG